MLDSTFDEEDGEPPVKLNNYSKRKSQMEYVDTLPSLPLDKRQKSKVSTSNSNCYAQVARRAEQTQNTSVKLILKYPLSQQSKPRGIEPPGHECILFKTMLQKLKPCKIPLPHK